MKRRILKLVLIMAVCFSWGFQAYANTGYSSIQPRYADIMNISYSFNIDENGEAYYGATVGVDRGEEIKIYLELQEWVDSDWETIKTSSKRRYEALLSFYDTCDVDPDGTYRVYYEITDWYDGGTETVTKYRYY